MNDYIVAIIALGVLAIIGQFTIMYFASRGLGKIEEQEDGRE